MFLFYIAGIQSKRLKKVLILDSNNKHTSPHHLPLRCMLISAGV